MATATRTNGFSRGAKVWHGREIELAKSLFQAVRLTMGHKAGQRMAKKDPSRIFTRFRYSRPFMLNNEGVTDQMDSVGDCNKWGNKAPRRWIMTPARKSWKEFLKRTREAIDRPYYPETDNTFAAAAEALDSMGFAIAESLVVAMLFEAEGDEDILYRTKTIWRTGRAPSNSSFDLDD